MAWFQEKWVLRDTCKAKPIRDDADALWDSIAIPHETRWNLPLPSREGTLSYMREVRDHILDRLQRGDPSEELAYFVRYTTYHEDMHNEAFTYTRQTLEYTPPRFSTVPEGYPDTGGGPLAGRCRNPRRCLNARCHA